MKKNKFLKNVTKPGMHNLIRAGNGALRLKRKRPILYISIINL